MKDSMKSKTFAVVVTYNPEMELLSNNIKQLCRQVEKVVIYDNASKNCSDIESVVNNLQNVELIKNSENIGLPINYNRAASQAYNEGFEWLLIMDQDTILPEFAISKYSECICSDNVAVISPVIWDVNLHSTENIDEIPKEKYTIVENCISSGSLNRINTILEIGGFDEKMFIDYVDIDYCKNCRNHGFQIIRDNEVLVEHRIGNSTTHKVLGSKLRAYNTSPFRKYYYFRNRVYYAKKYGVSLIKEWRYYRGLLGSFVVLFFEDYKKPKIQAAIKGLIDGLKL